SNLWTPVFTGVTTFYEIIIIDGFVNSPPPGGVPPVAGESFTWPCSLMAFYETINIRLRKRFGPAIR
ncbi:MAG: hypothetical protein QME78_16310, partial [Thermodesulfobacteriota bacterium]|nr:hypothetical protein [Thermodesulfobacteriota bacterium]